MKLQMVAVRWMASCLWPPYPVCNIQRPADGDVFRLFEGVTGSGGPWSENQPRAFSGSPPDGLCYRQITARS